MCNFDESARRYVLSHLTSFMEDHHQFTAYDFYRSMRSYEQRNHTAAAMNFQNYFESGRGYFVTAVTAVRITHAEVSSFLRELANHGGFPTKNLIGTTLVPNGGPIVYFQMSPNGDVGRYVNRVRSGMEKATESTPAEVTGPHSSKVLSADPASLPDSHN